MDIKEFTEITEPYDVETNEAAVAPLGMELFTGGMSSCCALVITNDKKVFLAHVDPEQDASNLKDFIDTHFTPKDEKLKITIVMGADYPRVSSSKRKISKALEASSINYKQCDYKTDYEDFRDDVVVDSKGKIEIRIMPNKPKKEPDDPGSLDL